LSSLVDGFPRNFDNIQGWNEVIGNSAIVDGVLQIEAPEDVLVKRLLERGKSSGRSDDSEDVIRKRLQTYASSTLPVVDHFKSQGKVTFVSGDRPVDSVFEDTKAFVERTVLSEVLATNQVLLDAITAGDWGAYVTLADPAMTCFEPEAAELGLVQGLDFHRGAFEEGARGRAHGVLSGKPVAWMTSTMQAPFARLLGPKHALVTYVRASSPLTSELEGGVSVSRVAETRVWVLGETGAWKLIHVHRSPMPPLEPLKDS